MKFKQFSTVIFFILAGSCPVLGIFTAEHKIQETTEVINKDQLLIEASWEGDEYSVRNLLDLGVNVNALDSKKYTALIRALWRDDENIVKLLLDAGADVRVIAPSKRTCLMLASYNGNENMVKLLLHLGLDAIIDYQDEDGDTALMDASDGSYGEAESIVKLLLDAKANPNIANNKGVYPSKNAEERGYKKIPEILKKAEKEYRKNFEELVFQNIPLIYDLAKIVCEYVEYPGPIIKNQETLK